MPKPPQPSGLEMQILSVLWERGPSTVREVLESLPDRKPRAYTTVLSTMQVMERKRLIRRQAPVSGALVYAPAVSRQQVTRPVLRDLLTHLFGGRPSAVLQQLFEAEAVDAEELAEIRRLVEQHAASSSPPSVPSSSSSSPSDRQRKRSRRKENAQ